MCDCSIVIDGYIVIPFLVATKRLYYEGVSIRPLVRRSDGP